MPLYFTETDGAKSVTVVSTDLATNSSTVTRSFVKDATGPALTLTTPASTLIYSSSASLTLAGACESPYQVSHTHSYNGGASSAATNLACSTDTYTGDYTLTEGQGSYLFKLNSKDGLNNESVLNFTYVYDSSAPVMRFYDNTTSMSVSTAATSHTFSGTCETSSSTLQGSITVTGSGVTGSAAVSCSNSTWSYTVPTQTTDDTYTYSFVQVDRAGNTSTAITATWLRSAALPTLALTNSWQVSKLNTVTFGGSCDLSDKMSNTSVAMTGTDIDPALTCSGTAPTGTFAHPVAAQTADGSYTYTFSQTSSSSQTSIVTGTFVRDTTAPVVSSISIAEGATVADFRVSVSLAASDVTTVITKFCLQSAAWADDSTPPAIPIAPLVTDSCWQSIDVAPVGQVLSQNLSVTGYTYVLPLAPGKYTVFVYAQDQAQNISNSSGTHGVDAYTTTLTIPPPLQLELIATTDASNNVDTEFDLGDDLVIHWAGWDSTALPADAVTLAWSTNYATWSTIVIGISNTENINCSPAGNATGCYRWSAPTFDFLTVRVQLKNQNGKVIETYSSPLNTGGKIRHIAGKLSRGIGYDAQSYVLSYDQETNDRYSQPDWFVVTRDGVIYMIDRLIGIVKIDPKDQLVQTFIRDTNVYSGNGALTTSTTLVQPNRLFLDKSTPKQRLFIYDNTFMRVVDFNTNTITTISTIDPDIKSVSGDSLVYANTWQVFPTGQGIFASLYYTGDTGLYYERETDNVKTYLQGRGLFYLNETTLKWEPYVVDRSNYSSIMPLNIASRQAGDGIDVVLPTPSCESGISTFIPFLNDSGVMDKFQTRIYGASSYNSACDGNSFHYSLNHGPVRTATLTEIASSATMPTLNPLGGNYDARAHLGLDGKTYYYIRNSKNIIYNYDRTANSWSVIAGRDSAQESSCADGTLATQCDLRLMSIFVDESGTLYLFEKGRIRLIDKSGKIYTIAGQSPELFDAALSAKNISLKAGMGSSSVFRWHNGSSEEVIFNDYGKQRYLSVVGDTVTNLSGDGSRGEPIVDVSAPTVAAPISQGSYPRPFAIDKSNGAIFAGGISSTATKLGLLKLDRSGASPVWRIWIPEDCGADKVDFANNSHDTMPNQKLCLNATTSNTYSGFVGNELRYSSPDVLHLADDGRMLIYHGETSRYRGTTDATYTYGNYYNHNRMIFEVSTGNYSEGDGTMLGMSFKAGQRGFHNVSVEESITTSSLTSVKLIGSPTYHQFGWQFHENEWYFVQRSLPRELKIISAGGVVSTLKTSPNVFYNFKIVREEADNVAYSCRNAGNLQRVNLTTGVEANLNLKVPGLKCSGANIDYYEDGGERYLVTTGLLNEMYIIFALKLD